MLLFYDTETTGFMKRPAELDDPGQPYCVQLAAKLIDDDRNIVASMNVIIHWPGIDIPQVTSDIHGITTEDAQKGGMSPLVAFKLFNEMCEKAEAVIGHNISFDNQIYAVCCARLGIDRVLPKDRRCTMKLSKDIVQCPPTDKMVAAGRTGFKSPSLKEAYKHFTGVELEGAHDAMVDVDGCMAVYYGVETFNGVEGSNNAEQF